MLPALALCFLGNLKANASKNLFAVANGNGYVSLPQKGINLPTADKSEYIASFRAEPS